MEYIVESDIFFMEAGRDEMTCLNKRLKHLVHVCRYRIISVAPIGDGLRSFLITYERSYDSDLED